MLTADEIGRAGSYVEELRQFVHELDVPSANRSRAAGACLAIAQEHHHAIIRLIEEKLFASAFALQRIEFEPMSEASGYRCARTIRSWKLSFEAKSLLRSIACSLSWK